MFGGEFVFDVGGDGGGLVFESIVAPWKGMTSLCSTALCFGSKCVELSEIFGAIQTRLRTIEVTVLGPKVLVNESPYSHPSSS